MLDYTTALQGVTLLHADACAQTDRQTSLKTNWSSAYERTQHRSLKFDSKHGRGQDGLTASRKTAQTAQSEETAM